MTVTAVWTNPSEGGPMDRDTGQTIREQDWDAVLGNLLVLGGTTGKVGSQNSLFVNGGFEIWQRGNGPFTAASVFSADRWQMALIGSATHSTTRDTANTDGGGACLAAVVGGASSTTNCPVLYQPTNLTPQISGRTITVSIRVKSAAAGSVCSYWYDGVTGGGSSQFGTPVATSTSYSTLTFTLTPASTAAQLNIGVAFLANTTYYLDNAMLVIGSVAADYAPLHPADDLARCQRYYEVVGDGQSSSYPRVRTSVGAASNDVLFPIAYKAIKAVTPTITKNGTWGVTNCSQPTMSGLTGLHGCHLSVASVAIGQIDAYQQSGCSVTIEANP